MPIDSVPPGRAIAMRVVLTLVMLIAVCGAVGASAAAGRPWDERLLATGLPKLPADARAVAERLASCTHFMGEFNGDRSEHDRAVNATLTELRCDRIDADVAGIRRTYRHDAAVQKALTDATSP